MSSPRGLAKWLSSLHGATTWALYSGGPLEDHRVRARLETADMAKDYQTIVKIGKATRVQLRRYLCHVPLSGFPGRLSSGRITAAERLCIDKLSE